MVPHYLINHWLNHLNAGYHSKIGVERRYHRRLVIGDVLLGNALIFDVLKEWPVHAFRVALRLQSDHVADWSSQAFLVVKAQIPRGLLYSVLALPQATGG